MTKSSIKNLLSDNYPLLSLLIGIGLVSVSIGPFQNGDTQWEYEAASGVIRWGMPYVISFGNIINQPPLGFYVEALFFKIFGLSFDVGIAVVTMFGIGSIILVYKIGKILYGKSTGLLAAALFALTPWEIILSRTFLIDVQCLFFSLFCLLVGISAIRKDSFKLSMISGMFFAAALLTKLFAVFTLIPLLLLYIYYRKNLKRTFSLLAAFVLPVLLFAFLWYQVISGGGLFSVFYHADFVNYNSSDVVPSYFFVGNFLFNYALGWFFMSATVLSLIVYFLDRKIFSKTLVFDLICLTTIVSVVSVNTFLGAGLSLEAPYFNAIKYDYQSLPFFSLLAATLSSKCLLLFNSAKSKRKLTKLLLFSVAFVGLFLLAASIFVNIFFANFFSRWNYLLFRVEMDKNVGYSLFNPNPIDEYDLLMVIQYLGFAFILSGLIWASRHKIAESLKSIHRWIETKSNKPFIETQDQFRTKSL